MSDDDAKALLKAYADAATERRLSSYTQEVEASQAKYSGGGHNSYPGRQSHRWLLPKNKGGRHMSLSAADRLGEARGETHDVEAEFKARDIRSLQRKDQRLGRGNGKRHPGRDRATTPLSPTPAWVVAPFESEGIGNPMDDPDPHTIMVYGRIPVPRDQLVDFLATPHNLVPEGWRVIRSPRSGRPDERGRRRTGASCCGVSSHGGSSHRGDRGAFVSDGTYADRRLCSYGAFASHGATVFDRFGAYAGHSLGAPGGPCSCA